MNASLRTLVILVSVVAASRAFAQCPADPATPEPDDLTCYVSVNGNDANPGTSASPMKTIQQALNRVATGAGTQTVRVLPGTYEECPILGTDGVPGDVDIVADDYKVRGVNTTTIVDGTNVCVPKQFPVFELGDNSSLEGFTIKGGGNSGVAAYGHVTISHNIIQDSLAPSIGGGVYLRTGANVSDFADQAFIGNNLIQNNKAALSGGGIYVYADGDGLPSSVFINSNTISGNIAGEGNTDAAIFGGGITIFTDSYIETDKSTVVITNNTIDGNETKGVDIDYPSYGGGVFGATFGAGTEVIEIKSTNVVRNNKATHGFGGGIAALGQALYPGSVDHHVLVESNAVSGNTAEFGGGGIFVQTSPLAIEDTDKIVVEALSNDVAGNSVTGATNAIGTRGGGGVYADFTNRQTNGADNVLRIANNSLRNNTSQSVGGGAALWVRTFGQPADDEPPPPLPASSKIQFTNNLVTGNHALDTQSGGSAGEGGGVFIQSFAQGGGSSAVDVKFNTLANNTADTGLSGGVAIQTSNFPGPTSGFGSSSIDVSNSIIISNSGFAVGGGAVPGVENTTVRIAYNDTFNNGAGPFAPQYLATAGPGNITVDPELDAFFVPLLCSPTIDAGDPCEGRTNCLGILEGERQPNGGVANLGHTGLTESAPVTLPDATGDHLVDGVDILRLATSFASQSGQVGRYNQAADVDLDGDIDGTDLSFMSAWFGKACP